MSSAIGVSVLDPSLYIPELKLRRRDSALHQMVSRAHGAGAVREPALLLETLALRERRVSAALGKGVAIPQARSIAVIEPRLVVARSKRGIDWSAPDRALVHLILLVLAPAELPEEAHHEFIARAAGVALLQRNRQKLLAAEGFEAVAAVLREVTP